MADTTSVTKTILSVCATIGSKLQDLNIKNGNLIYVQDKHRIALDYGGKRVFYNQIEELESEAERVAILAPLSGCYYFVIETAVLWTYQNGWIQITTPPEEIVFIGTEMPELGSPKTLYVNKENKEISVFDEDTNEYIIVADRSDTISESDLDLLFA